MNRRARDNAAFTLIELLAVVVIIILLIGLAVPAFSALIASSQKSLAQNKLSVSLSGAQSEAYASGGERDAAAVFTFEPGGRMTVLTCVYAGTIIDETGGGVFLPREVFAPVASTEPLQLPIGWTVRGFAPSGSIDEDWYEDARYAQDQGNWVFPETGFFDDRVADDGQDRHSFVVRFDASTGHMDIGNPQDILVFDPRLTSLGRTAEPYKSYPAEQVDDAEQFVRRVTLASNLSEGDRRDLLGDRSGDTILARPVSYLSLLDERLLAGSIGTSLDRSTDSLYQRSKDPTFVTGLTAAMVNGWIEGKDSQSGDPIETEAKVYRVDRYAGSVEEVSR